MILNKNLTKYFSYFFGIYLISIIIFGRTFNGIYIFGFRLGELVLGFSVMTSMFILFNVFNLNEISKSLTNLYRIIIISYLVVYIFTQSGPLDLYNFKSSSYIWTLSFIYFGVMSYPILNKSKTFIIFLALSLPATYILSTTYYPHIFKNFFFNYSDKFDFVKASDIFIAYLFINIFLRINFKKPDYTFFYFLVSSGVLFPILLYKSKGSFLGICLFFIFELLNYLWYIKKFKVKSLFFMAVSLLFFIMSLFQSSGDLTFNINMGNEEQFIGDITPNEVTKKISETVKTKVPEEDLKLIYIFNNRLYSSDATINWRIQIWQDVLFDLTENKKLLFGYGYKEIIPAMEDIDRTGMDRQNENVHNYIITIFARGGIFHLILFIYFYYLLVKLFFIKNKNYQTLLIIIPGITVALFDTAMESVRYPFLFYFLIGNFFLSYKKTTKD